MLVEGLPRMQAVVELADHAIEQMPLGPGSECRAKPSNALQTAVLAGLRYVPTLKARDDHGSHPATAWAGPSCPH